MAGVGFSLRKAIKSEKPLQSAEGYFSAAFTSGGTILVGILIVVMLQVAATQDDVDTEVIDRFMCYVTQTMFFSMLLTSLILMVLARYVADKLYIHQYEKVMSSMIGASFIAVIAGSLFFSVLMLTSEISYPDTIWLLLLLVLLENCWILMSYISLVRNYRIIARAYFLALAAALFGVIILHLAGKLSLYSMMFVLILAYAVIDACLFAGMYQNFPLTDYAVFGFAGWIRKYPYLVIIGFCCMSGMLGHFLMDWMFSENASVISGMFRFDSTYDFPAILGYCSTIPAMCYFVTFFETGFEEKYRNYFKILGGGGGKKEIEDAHHEMLAVLAGCLKVFSIIQLISCVLFMTVFAKLLAVFNIGMTTDMLYTFRVFCIAYSFYAIGNILILLQLYFLNDRAAALSSVVFMIFSITGARITVNTSCQGFSLLIASAVLMIMGLFQLSSCLMRLEEHILLRQPIHTESRVDAGNSGFVWRKLKIFGKYRTQEIAFLLVLVLLCTGVEINNLQKESRIFTFYPEASEEVLVSPGMGLAPWANSEETLNMETSLVYVEIKWSDWEPEDGQFNAEWVEEEYYLDIYREEGRQVVLRFICDEPGEEEHMDIPQWLYDKINGDGEWYDTSYGMGFSPNYENEILIEEHAQAIAALGAAFGNDDFIVYVELGSLGHWGEWHTNIAEGLSGMPSSDIREQYILPYLSAFPNAQFLLRYSLSEVNQYNMGMYNDMTGDYDETGYWLEMMKTEGIWEQTGEEDQSICEDVWKTNPIGGEFASSYEDNYFLNQELSTTLELLKQSHQSFIGPKIIVDDSDSDYEEAMSQILCTIGYRYRVNRVQIDLSDSEYIQVSCTFINDGIAPIYKNYSVMLYLYNEDGEVVSFVEGEDFSLMSLLPEEESTLSLQFEIGEMDDDEMYTLAVAVTDDDGNACIPLALTDEIEDEVYCLAEFSLNQAGN